MKKSEAMKKSVEVHDYEIINDALAGMDYSFSQGFTDRVMQRLDNRSVDLFSSFKKVALTSAAAVALLVMSVYFTDGSLSLDSLFGLQNYSAEQEFYSLLIN